MKVFFVYTIASLLLFISSFLAAKFYSEYSYITVSISMVVQFIILSILYFKIIRNSKIKKLITLGAIAYIFFWLYIFLKSNFTDLDTTPFAVECIFFTFLIVYYFFEIMRYSLDTQLFELPSFWISVAFLINFSGTFIVFLLGKSLINEFPSQYLIIVSTITIIKNILLCTAVIANKSFTLPKNHSSLPPDLNLDSFQPFNNKH